MSSYLDSLPAELLEPWCRCVLGHIHVSLSDGGPCLSPPMPDIPIVAPVGPSPFWSDDADHDDEGNLPLAHRGAAVIQHPQEPLSPPSSILSPSPVHPPYLDLARLSLAGENWSPKLEQESCYGQVASSGYTENLMLSSPCATPVPYGWEDIMPKGSSLSEEVVQHLINSAYPTLPDAGNTLAASWMAIATLPPLDSGLQLLMPQGPPLGNGEPLQGNGSKPTTSSRKQQTEEQGSDSPVSRAQTPRLYECRVPGCTQPAYHKELDFIKHKAICCGNRWICGICSQSFLTSPSRSNHIYRKHSKKGQLAKQRRSAKLAACSRKRAKM
ncbi:hypothetical protein GQ53DRAFT_752329 [Thozetella sp. PMI_491]|nr:hypothetical protein GQ53DRAFT_752329 [Thozetella sp. PMI_491]